MAPPPDPGRRPGARRPLTRSRAFACAAAVAVLGFASGWHGSGRDLGAAGRPPYLTVFLIDGLAEDVFAAQMAAGRLPHIGALARRGAFVEHGISAFPSMTAYGFHPFLTGQDAARSGVLGLRWFDRHRRRGNLRSYVGFTQDLIDTDRAPRPLTLFERVGAAHTLSVNTYANRGVRDDVRVGWSFAMAKYRDVWAPARALAALPLAGNALVPDWERAEARALQVAIDDLPQLPKVQWITLSALDGYQHVHGTDGRYAGLLRHADGLIGRYQDASRRLGQEPDRVYAVVSDHGVTDARANVDLRAVLRECCGLRAQRDAATRFRSSSLDVPVSDYDEADAVVVVNGNMLNYVYVRDPAAAAGGAWRHPLSERALSRYGPRGADLVAGLLGQAGIELVVLRGDEPGTVVVSGRGGRGVITAARDRLAYRSAGVDPLGYDALSLADGAARTAEEWLAATHGTRYPDALHRLAALMANPDAGDLVVLSAPGYDLGADYELVVANYRGGHGGLRADQLRVPYVLAGPGVADGARLPAARAEDVGVTLLALLGLAAEPEADGRLLREALAPTAAQRAR